MKDEKDKKPARVKWRSKYTKFYAVIGAASLVLAITIIATATALGNKNNPSIGAGGGTQIEQPGGNQAQKPDDTPVDNPGDNVDTPVDNEDEMAMPMLQVSLLNDHGFFYNKTLNYYGQHDGVDFSAEVGTEVFCVLDGVVESVYKADVLCGTEIVVDHGDGLKSVYRFITETEGLQAGVEVGRGQLIATVAEANGGEYKDGAHLHFEVMKNGVSVDPAEYLSLADK